tara:strand:+ start:182 stop:424 length:243 start_codon:yes stop_codon:yes gene_type:complete
MPSIGEKKTRYGRQFIFVNPDDNLGPGNWRLSTVDEINNTGGGGSGGINDVDGVSPVVSTTVGAGDIDISLDISSLDEKA